MQVTVAALVEASKKNGFPWARENRSPESTRGVFSCVVGQGMINLYLAAKPPYYDELPAVFPYSLQEVDSDIAYAFKRVYRFNDHEAQSYEEAVRFMEETLAPFMEEEVTI